MAESQGFCGRLSGPERHRGTVLRTATVAPGVALALLALASFPSEAQNIAVYPVQNDSAQMQLTRNSPEVAIGFTIANNGPAKTTLKIAVRPFHHGGGEPCGPAERDCTLAWQLGGKLLPADTPSEAEIEPYGNVHLWVKGSARSLGTYDSAFVAGPASGSIPAPVIQTVRIRREVPNLGAGAVTLGPGGIRTAGPFGGINAIRLGIVNDAGTAVPLPQGSAQLLRDDGSNSYTFDAGTIDPTCVPAGNWPRPLDAGEALTCTLPLRPYLTPGRYRLDFALPASGIAKTNVVRDFSIRFHWSYALLALLLGATAGGWFAGWQNSGRRRALQAAEALTLGGKYDALSAQAPVQAGSYKSRPIIDEAIGRLEEILQALRTVSTADFAAELDALGSRLPFLHRFVVLEKSFVDAGRPAAAQSAYAAAAQAVGASPLPADVDSLVDQFAAALQLAAPAGARVGGISATAPGEFFIKIGGATSTALRALVRRVDALLLWITILLVALIGVVTLWQPNATWGGIGDFLVALFTGFAATSAGTAGLRELTSSYTLRRI